MSYGFIAKNNNDEIVFDSEVPVYYLTNEQTVSGTLQTIPSPFNINYYTYPTQWGAKPKFARLDIGDLLWVGEGGTLASNRATLDVREADVSSNLNPSNNYGLEILNANGEIVFSSDFDLVPIEDKWRVSYDYSIQANTSLANGATGEWVHIANNTIYTSYIGGNIYALFSSGVRRVSNNKYEYEDFLMDFVTPAPLQVVFDGVGKTDFITGF